MKKSIISLFLSLSLICSLCCSSVFAAETQDNTIEDGVFTFRIEDGKEAVLVDCSNEAAGELTIPSEIQGYPVVRIDRVDHAGDNGDQRRKLVNVSKINIPDSVKEIGVCAFERCDAAQINIGKNVTKIGFSAFERCRFETITLPNSLKVIGAHCFNSCENLKSLEIPENVSQIDGGLAGGSKNLKEIKVNRNNKYYTSVNGIVYTADKKKLVSFPGIMTNYNVPYGTEIIGHEAAWEVCLKEVTLPNTLQKIEMSAFAANQLQSITIPNSVTYIGDDAFGSNALRTIEIPGTVEDIRGDIVSANENLVQVILNEGVKTIGIGELGIPRLQINGETIRGRDPFNACNNLSSLFIPSSVTRIMLDVLWGLGNKRVPLDIYYAGSEAQWMQLVESYSDDIDSRISVHFNSRISDMPDVSMDNTSNNNQDKSDNDQEKTSITKDYTFEYYNQYTNKASPYIVSFNPDWFVTNQSSYTYNHDIAKASLAMAMAGANTKETEIKKFYETLGFDAHPEFNYPTPTENSIGYAIASKELKDGSTLIAVTVRGGQYHEEWVSNFKVGAFGIHQGFNEAATNVVNGIKAYISKYGISGKKKIWITGYSRAAATTNIAAHNLDVMAEQTHEIKNLAAKDIYAFCFECPRTVIDPPKTSLNNNIFCIVNYIDFVTEVAPAVWNYSRYGITLTLPGAEVSSHKTYGAQYKKMQNEYKKILDKAGVSETSKTAYMDSQGTFIRECFGKLGNWLGGYRSGIDGAFRYTEKYQSQLQDVGRVYGQKERYGREEFFGRILLEAVEAFPGFIATHGVLEAKLIKNGKMIGAAHYPELCLAWMNTLNSITDFEMDPDRIYRINCPVDVDVYDDGGKLVAQIINDEVQDISGDSVPAYIDEDEQKVISIPASEDYRIVIKARENCNVSCQIEEKDLADGTTLRTVNYYDIAMKKNQKLEAGVPETEPDHTEKYSLLGDNGKAIMPTEDISGEISKCVLQAEPVENGNVQGGGVYTKGEFALLKAEPNSGYRFSGWYEGDKLLSSEAEYRFRMETDRSIRAVFQKVGQQILFDDVPEGKWFSDAVYYCRDKGYMAGKGNNKFDPDGTVTRGTITQVLFAMEGKPKVAKTAEFKDVASGQWYADSVNWAASIGIVAGYSKDKFGPNDPITRQQLVAILYQFSKYKKYDVSATSDISKFKDASSIAGYAITPVKWAVANGIISGTDSGLEPKGTATRAQIAVILRAYDLAFRQH